MKEKVCVAVCLYILLTSIICADEVRTWTSANGAFTTQAEFVRSSPDDKIIFLLKTDGKEISVPLDRLSKADQSYLQKRQPTIKDSRLDDPLAAKNKVVIDGMLKDFYDKYSLPGGVSMAISYRERLVYAGAVGFADEEHQIPLTAERRMRLASVSKPITAIAVMKLIEEKKLNLNEKVFGQTGVFQGEYGMPKLEERPVEITVQQLLEHAAGGWGNLEGDPMSKRIDSRMEFMKTVLRDYPLEHSPGTKYDYSNFGFCVLGRVIEHKSGKTYEEYVQENILQPCGIKGMRIGGKTSASDEVEYMKTNNRRPYTLSPLHMDAHGGWIAQPVEILKLLVHVDGFSRVPDMLESDTIKTMTTSSAQNKNYALGWCVNSSNNWWHTGSMPGTSAMIGRGSGGFNWVILINSQPASAPEFSGDLDDLFWNIRKKIAQWHIGTEL